MIAKVSALTAQLQERARKSGTVTIGLAGAGQMGTDIVVQVAQIEGLRIGAIAELYMPMAIEAIRLAGHADEEVKEAATAAEVDRAIEGGSIALTQDFEALAAAGRIDVVIDATGNPNAGTMHALSAIRNGKHIVMLSVEADITVGRHLKREAKRAGLVYTGAAGDEPAATVELIGFAQSIGLQVIAAGKGKNNPLKFDAVPGDYETEARARNMNARMLVEFVDGSKTMIEMVAVANATGLVPDQPGMHGPAATVSELARVLVPRSAGGILAKAGCVDYSIGKGVAPGVFCIVTSEHPRLRERLADLKVGEGPYFTLHRPFHLTSLEVPLTAARAVLFNRPDMEPLDHPVAEAVAVAKRDLASGDILGRIGESDYRAWAMTAAEAQGLEALPVGLAEKARMLKPVRKGEFLTRANCVADGSLAVTQIREALDRADRDHRFLAAS